ncbi:MAG: 3-dehydroquinate synthase [Ruminococcaceae bacterium]|nr:3-dehydroquinate synthase [Oscillospiraceae bacterium]
MNINVKTSNSSYDVHLESGALSKVATLLNLQRKVLIVTDSGVPKEYSQLVFKQCKEPYILTVEQGEASKQIDNWQWLLKTMAQNNFTRSDCVVAVGGGVVGDFAGFAAACYMRGIDFYNIPTTVLSQVDSSIGGKTAVDFMGYKNLVGAFYPPKKVVIDFETIKTLPPRQVSNGLCEALKMAATNDKELFEIFDKTTNFTQEVMQEIIYRALLIKKSVVEADEHEAGLRKVLNFGHTIAHAVESINQMEKYYHGECVAIGMLPMCSAEVREKLKFVLEKLGLPTQLTESANQIIETCKHDKKTSGDNITVVTVEKIGEFKMKEISFSEFSAMVRSVAK